MYLNYNMGGVCRQGKKQLNTLETYNYLKSQVGKPFFAAYLTTNEVRILSNYLLNLLEGTEIKWCEQVLKEVLPNTQMMIEPNFNESLLLQIVGSPFEYGTEEGYRMFQAEFQDNICKGSILDCYIQSKQTQKCIVRI